MDVPITLVGGESKDDPSPHTYRTSLYYFIDISLEWGIIIYRVLI